MVAITRAVLPPTDRHTPPPGLASGEPDDRLQRSIQYAAASLINHECSGILDHPPSRVTTGLRVDGADAEARLLTTRRGFATRYPPTSTPAFLSSTRAASLAARAIAGSSRTRSCAIEPSTSRVSCVARPSGSATPSCTSRSRNQRRRLSLKAMAIFLTDRSSAPSSATALTNGQPRKPLLAKPRSSRSNVARICSTGGWSEGGARVKRRSRYADINSSFEGKWL